MTGLAYWPADTSEAVLELTTGDLLRQAAADAGERAALIEIADDADRRWTYGELLAEAEQCAYWLLTRFTPGERITVWAPNIPEWMILQYGAALAGLTLVSANPALRAEELRYVLRQSRSSGLFHTDAFRGSDMAAIAREAADGLPELREMIGFASWDDTVRAHAGTGTLPNVRPQDPAQIQYTSGTTGFPKGALLHHRGLVTNARFMIDRSGLPAGGVYVSPMPLFHTAGCAMGVLGCAHKRAAYGLCRLFEPGLVLRAVAELGADMTGGVPTMLIAMLNHPEFESLDLSRLSLVLSGGSPIPPELVSQVEERFGARFGAVYGQTELSPVITQTGPADAPEDRAGTAGRPLPRLELSVRDPGSGETVPYGEVGEICARGYQAMLGYFEMPERTAETIDADGWVHTGDLGALDDGYLSLRGRTKELIITAGGENVSPVAVEFALTAEPLIGQACVVGDGRPALGALVVLDRHAASRWAAGRGIRTTDMAELAGHPEVRAEVGREIAAANETLVRQEKVRRFRVLPDEWLPDSDELTPTAKLRRGQVAAKYAAEIAAMYEAPADLPGR